MIYMCLHIHTYLMAIILLVSARFEDSFYKPLDRSGFGKGPVPTATRAWFYAGTPSGEADSLVKHGELWILMGYIYIYIYYSYNL